jgi:hypothetical protein
MSDNRLDIHYYHIRKRSTSDVERMLKESLLNKKKRRNSLDNYYEDLENPPKAVKAAAIEEIIGLGNTSFL